ncbi:sodium:solute symporter [Candidatus Margulisiibacteriota bacterium]
MNYLTIIVIGIYILISILIGFFAYSKSKKANSADYFIAGRALSWVHLGFTLFATWFSTFAILGSAGFHYKNGISWFLVQGFIATAAPLLVWFIGKKVWLLGKKKGHITQGDMIAGSYHSSKLHYIVAVISLIALLPYCLIQLVGIGKILAVSTNNLVPYWAGVLIATLAIGLYSFFGGMKAIVWTDVLQGLIFGAILLFGCCIVVIESGGLIKGFSIAIQKQPDLFTFHSDTAGNFLTLLIIWTLGFVTLPHMFQRFYMAKSAKTIGRSITLSVVLGFLLVSIPTMIIGLLSVGLIDSIKDTDTLLPVLFAQYAPLTLPLLVLGIFAAGMSTIDSQLLCASSIIIRDILGPFLKKRNLEINEKVGGKIVIVSLITIVTIIALSPISRQSSIIVIASKGTGLALLLFTPILFALLGRKWISKSSAVFALIIGFFIYVLLECRLIHIPFPLGLGAPVIAFSIQILVYLTGLILGKILRRKTDGRSYCPDISSNTNKALNPEIL